MEIWLLKVLMFFYFFTRSNTQTVETVEYYEDIIKKGMANSANYKEPIDASMYKAPKAPIKYFGSYDFVIIGGGVTGSVIASRLSERADFRVLVIEAGNFTDNGIIQFPAFSVFGILSDYNWAYKSIPQNTACLGAVNNICNVPRGRGVGGTSLINALISSRGHPDDYNTWARVSNDPSWSYENVLPYFKKLENFNWTNPKAPVDLDYHGTRGLLKVQQKIPNIIFNDIFLNANVELGAEILDYNSNKQKGASIFQLYTKKGRRQDLGSAYLIPYLNRTNLKVLTQSYVIKIEINQKTKVAQSVLFTKGGTTYRVKARKEVILSAGAIASPQILMLSGVGPIKHLKEVNISLIQDLEVGSKSRDHIDANILFSTNVVLPPQDIKQQLQDYLQGIGDLTSVTTIQGVAFYETENSTRKGIPNLEIFTDAVSANSLFLTKSITLLKGKVSEALWANHTSAFSFGVIHTDPKSTGTIRLKSSNPFEYPLINPNLLSDPENKDIDEMYQSIQLLFKIAESKAYQSLGLNYMSNPLPDCSHLIFKSKEYWYCYIRQITLTAFHPMATCPMGRSPKQGAVVDSNLKVFGIKRLRVADASIFPISSTGHPSVPCIMVGEKISDYIKNHYS